MASGDREAASAALLWAGSLASRLRSKQHAKRMSRGNSGDLSATGGVSLSGSERSLPGVAPATAPAHEQQASAASSRSTPVRSADA
jgi:hypothetical protein